MPLFNTTTTTTTDDSGNETTTVTVEAQSAPDLETSVDTPSTVAVYPNEPQPNIEGYTVNGSPWNTKAYYSQALDSSDQPARLDLSLSAADQQYYEIRDYQLLVTDGLNPSTDSDQITTLSGTALTWPGLGVNIGDVFVANMVDARTAVFVITDATKISYFRKTSYQITYEFLAYFTEEYQTDLSNKTALTYYFDPDHPFVIGETEKVHSNRINARKYVTLLAKYFWQKFFNPLQCAFIVPDDDYTNEVDVPLTKFMLEMLPQGLIDKLPKVYRYNLSLDRSKPSYGTVWDVLMNKDIDLINFVEPHVNRIGAGYYQESMIYSGVSFSNVSYLLMATATTTDDSLVLDDYYVFTEAFYEQDSDNVTTLEGMVLNAIDGQLYNTEDLEDFVTGVRDLDDDVAFYRIPVYIWLLKQLLVGDW